MIAVSDKKEIFILFSSKNLKIFHLHSLGLYDSDENGSICGDRTPAIGIDLGTTNSCVAVVIDGRSTILVDPETNSFLIPSCVAFTDTECLVGESAKSQANGNEENTIFNTKRLIGRLFTDESVQNYIQFWPFKLIDSKHGPQIQVKFKGQNKNLTAIEVNALILKKLKSIAEHYLGQPITDAVITVPANFNNRQRESTKVSGRIAGLNVMRVLNEPTAAAMAYSIDRTNENKSVCIFDLGGGTFDVTILTFKRTGAIRVRSTAGDPNLGGEDFDNKMIEHVTNQIRQTDSSKDIEISNEIKHRIRQFVVQAKHALSMTNEITIKIDNLCNGNSFETKVTRAEFESMIAESCQKAMTMVHDAIKNAPILVNGVEDIKEVVLVGGSSRIPMVSGLLRQSFGHATIHSSKNPDSVVAIGAAIQAAILNGDQSENISNVLLWDVLPLSLGIRASESLMNVILPRNTQVPDRRVKAFRTKEDNQRSVTVEVYEGEHKMVLENNLLGSFTLTDLPDGSRLVKRIFVTFDIDADGILNVTAKIKDSNIEKKIEIQHTAGRLDEFEIRRMIANANELVNA